jgi:hypothetical protein
MIEHILLFWDTHCGIFNSTVSVSIPPVKFFSLRMDERLTQVASLASRHEQSTVRAAFFCPL